MELGNYNVDFVDKFVEYGHYFKKDKEILKIEDILTGNGIVAIILSSKYFRRNSNADAQQPKEIMNSSLKQEDIELKI